MRMTRNRVGFNRLVHSNVGVASSSVNRPECTLNTPCQTLCIHRLVPVYWSVQDPLAFSQDRQAYEILEISSSETLFGRREPGRGASTLTCVLDGTFAGLMGGSVRTDGSR